MAKQTKLDRILIFSYKIICTQLKGINPSAIKGRFNGHRVLANSIPKAGTNMMERTLTFMPGMRMAPFRTLVDWGETSSRTVRRLKKLHKGQFINAHITANPEVFDLVNNLGIKTLFLIRDPRDVLVSHYKYVNEIDTTHPSHKFIASLLNDHDRLTAVITGKDGLIAPVGELWQRYDGWLTDPNTLVIKFEHLIGNQGGGDSEAQLNTIRAIASHLDIKLSSSEIERIASNVYSTKTSTFRKGKIGTWRNVFADDHVELFKAYTDDLLIKLGYESNNHWGV